MAAKRRGRRAISLAGTNLEFDPRTGIYRWRNLDERSGRRVRRSTGTRDLRRAILIAQQFEEEHQRELAGLSNYGEYRRPLTGFVEPFLESLSCSQQRVDLLRKRLHRAFKLLGVSALADLEDFVKIERKVLRLEGTGPGRFSRKNLAEGFQGALKQFCGYLAGRREIPVDHLAAWPRIKSDEPGRERRALTPDEMARALAASDRLDAMCGRVWPLRPVWTAMLITAPRVSALAALDVSDFDRAESRLRYKGTGNKRPGAGALDDKTLGELEAYAGGRADGPLFRSPQGKRIDKLNSLVRWRASVSLAAVDMEWPDGEPRDLHTAYLVHCALASGRIQVAMGGPLSGPHQPGPEKLKDRTKRRDHVRCIADAIRSGWETRMRGVDQHCLRMTHRTWALAAGVPEILIDRQLGHTSSAGQAALQAAWSMVGRNHYTDMNFLTFDARRSADAVRDMLDRAEAEYQDLATEGRSFLSNGRDEGLTGLVSEAL